jgi:hypothetical protein
VIRALAAWLALAPALQALSLAGLAFANFAPDRPWSYVAYGLGAPYVAWLIWRRHPRARFAAYVFLSHEMVRGAHLGRWEAVGIAMAWVLSLQGRGARAWMPAIRPADFRPRRRGAPPRAGGPAPG